MNFATNLAQDGASCGFHQGLCGRNKLTNRPRTISESSQLHFGDPPQTPTFSHSLLWISLLRLLSPATAERALLLPGRPLASGIFCLAPCPFRVTSSPSPKVPLCYSTMPKTEVLLSRTDGIFALAS